MTPIEILKAARKLISDPAKWTQKVDACDAIGGRVNPRDVNAVCWCADGAMVKAIDDPSENKELRLARAMLSHSAKIYHNNPDGGDFYYIRINDFDGHEAILKVFDHAIENNS